MASLEDVALLDRLATHIPNEYAPAFRRVLNTTLRMHAMRQVLLEYRDGGCKDPEMLVELLALAEPMSVRPIVT